MKSVKSIFPNTKRPNPHIKPPPPFNTNPHARLYVPFPPPSQPISIPSLPSLTQTHHPSPYPTFPPQKRRLCHSLPTSNSYTHLLNSTHPSSTHSCLPNIKIMPGLPTSPPAPSTLPNPTHSPPILYHLPPLSPLSPLSSLSPLSAPFYPILLPVRKPLSPALHLQSQSLSPFPSPFSPFAFQNLKPDFISKQ